MNAINLVKENGTLVVSGTCRFIIPLLGQFLPISFVNIKDSKNPENAAWANQNLKGDGNDVFLINGLTPEQVKLIDDYVSDYIIGGTIMPLDEYDIQDLIGFCDENNLEDRYCSNQEYCTKNFVFPDPVGERIEFVGFFPRSKDKVCRAAIVPVGFEYSDGEKSQVANVQGALLVVSEDSVRITNVPEDYQVLNPDEQIVGIEEI